jgi:hypothetical protein
MSILSISSSSLTVPRCLLWLIVVQEAKRGLGASAVFIARNRFAVLDKGSGQIQVGVDCEQTACYDGGFTSPGSLLRSSAHGTALLVLANCFTSLVVACCSSKSN